MSGNRLEMPLAEWLMRMSIARVAPPARMLAVYASVLDIAGNDELASVTGISGRTFDKHKRDLLKDGWVLVARRTGGRGRGIEVSPAVNGTPVKFTDVSIENPRDICARLAQQTPAIVADVLRTETPAETAPLLGETPAIIADVSTPRALAHTRLETPSGLVIINNNQSHTPTHVEQEAARVGEEAVGHGVFVNCETVRHRDFTISIAGIAMQLATAPIDMTPDQRSEAARTSAIAHAVQWAAEIEGGKRARDVVPSHVANFIRGAIVGQFNKSARGGRAPVGRPGEGEAQRRMRIISQITGGQS